MTLLLLPSSNNNQRIRQDSFCFPALGAAPPWSCWFSEKPPNRQRPEDRRLTREAQKEEQRRLQEEGMRQERQRKREEENERREREAEMRRELEEAKHRERKVLENQLAAERAARVESERKMAKEIRRLEGQLARVGAPSGPPSIRGSVSLPETPITPQGPSVTTPVSEDPVEDIIKSLLERSTQALDHCKPSRLFVVHYMGVPHPGRVASKIGERLDGEVNVHQSVFPSMFFHVF